jgi:hypothetical protein
MYLNLFIFIFYLFSLQFMQTFISQGLHDNSKHARKAYAAIKLYKLGKSYLISLNFSLLLTATTRNLYFNFKGLSLILSGPYTSPEVGSIRF